MSRYSVIGYGSLHDIIKEIIGAYEYEGFYDDGKTDMAGRKGKFSDIQPAGQNFILGFAAIRNMLIREKIYRDITASGGKFINAISDKAHIYKSAQVGTGNIITPFAVIGANAVIGNNCILFSNTTVEHDCRIGDNVNFAPSVSLGGKVTVGNNVFLGIGSCVRDGVTIGNNVIIGAGSAVLQDIPDNMVVYGHPAKTVSANDRYLAIK